MAIDREEWDDFRKDERVRRLLGRQQLFTQLAQAEVPAQLLLQDQNFNYFLSLLQQRLETSQSQLAAEEEKRRRSTDFDHANLARAQAACIAWQARIDLLEEIISLPRQIIDDGEIASKFLQIADSAAH